MPNYKEKECKLCGDIYTPTSPKQKYCVDCRRAGKRIKDRVRERERGRVTHGYTECDKVCPVCGIEFKTFYSSKVYCGSDSCEKERVRIKNHRTHLLRDKDYMMEKGRAYYTNNRERECLKKASKYRTQNPGTGPYIPGRVYKHNLDYVVGYIEGKGYKFVAGDYENNRSRLTLLCPEGHTWETTFHGFKDAGVRCMKCYTYNLYVSRPEQKVRDYVESNIKGVKCIYNDREKIAPLELDILFPEQNLAVEVCGLYWHSDTANGVEKSYHYDKMVKCFEKGIRLITIFEDEIEKNFDLVMSRIRQALGVVDRRVYARKCKVEVIDNKEANSFLNDHHLQGGAPCKIAFGLYYVDELVSVCTLGNITRHNAALGKTLEIKRFCSLKDLVVVGGAGKLFKRAIEFAKSEGYDNLKSYCDMRYANIFNPVYEVLGFELLTMTKYTPHYCINGDRYRNMSLRKTPEERLTGKTELELRLEQGYDRIWDCGHRTYVFKIN